MLAITLGLLALALLILGLALIIANVAVLPFGAPYLPSLKPHVAAALELLDLKPGQVIYDLGCGDGRFLIAAAKAGYQAVGYELNPFMFGLSWLVTRRYRRQVTVRFGNFWKADLSDADAVYVFLFDRYMKQLDKKLKATGKRLKLASHTFKIPGKPIITQNHAVYLYEY